MTAKLKTSWGNCDEQKESLRWETAAVVGKIKVKSAQTVSSEKEGKEDRRELGEDTSGQ